MAMIYLLDGNQEVIKIVRNSAVISAIQTQELPEDNSLLRDYLSVRLKNDERLFNAQYMAIKSYGGNRNAFDLYRIASELVPDNATEFMGVQVAPYELEGVVIEDLRPQDRPLNQTMNQVLEGSDWRLGYMSDNLPNVTTNFYYVSVKDALKKIQELTNVEMLFKVEITGNKITDKWVEVYHQLGNRTMKRFNYGTNALQVVRETSHNEVYTALIGRGKGEEVGETESGDATYGRKINFADVEWQESAGNPVDKPKGQKYIELSNATAEYGVKLLDGRKVPRIGIVEFSDTDDPEKLIQETYQELLIRARPKVLFKASVINTGDMLIGDTVTIHRHDLGFHYQARVRKVVRDRKNNNQTQVEIGDVVHTPSTKRQGQVNSALNNITSDLENARGEITEARSSADGKNTNFYGNVEPERKKVGDTWFRDHPSLAGESQILVWNGEAWELIMDTSETTKNAEAVLEAKGIAETARDNALNIATDLMEGTSFYKHTQDIGLASKNSDGTINSIINLGSDGTAYVGGENIVLDGNTIVDGTFTITDKMIAPNAEIDGAKIQDATIGSAKIAGLDVGKISGNTAEFVRAAFNSISSTTSIDGNGISILRNDGSRSARLGVNGYEFWLGGKEHGSMGTRKYTGTDPLYLNKNSISLYARRDSYLSLGYQGDKADNNDGYVALSILGDTGNVNVNNYLTFDAAGSIWGTRSSGHLSVGGENQLSLIANDRIIMQISDNGSPLVDVYGTMNMRGRNTLNSNAIEFGTGGVVQGEIYPVASNRELQIRGTNLLRFVAGGAGKMIIRTSGATDMYTPINMNGYDIERVHQLRLLGPNTTKRIGIFNNGTSDQIYVQGWGGVRIGDRRSDTSYATHFEVTQNGNHSYVSLNMNGNGITNQSDIRLKRNIEDSSLDALREIERLKFIEYDWDKEKSINEGKPTERQFGIVAQYSPFLQTKAGESESYLSVDLTKQINLNSKATQELLHYTRMLEERIEVLESERTSA